MKSPELLQTDKLYQDIEAQIDRIKSKKNRYLTYYRLARLFIFAGGAAITVLTGWQLAQGKPAIAPGPTAMPLDSPAVVEAHLAWIKNIVLIISAAISVLTAVEGLFNFREKGKGNNVILFDLRMLRDEICFAHNEQTYDQAGKVAFFLRYQKILAAQRILIENSDDNEG